jgi:hypothetical protein
MTTWLPLLMRIRPETIPVVTTSDLLTGGADDEGKVVISTREGAGPCRMSG